MLKIKDRKNKENYIKYPFANSLLNLICKEFFENYASLFPILPCPVCRYKRFTEFRTAYNT